MSDWFTTLLGFPESTYAATQARLQVDGSTLRSRVTGRAFHIGTLSTPSLGELRQRARETVRVGTRGPRVSSVVADVDRPARPGLNHSSKMGPVPQSGTGPVAAATVYRNDLMPVGGGREHSRNARQRGASPSERDRPFARGHRRRRAVPPARDAGVLFGPARGLLPRARGRLAGACATLGQIEGPVPQSGTGPWRSGRRCGRCAGWTWTCGS